MLREWKSNSARQGMWGDPKSRSDGTEEWRNGGITERRKITQILKDGIAESRNGGKYPQILKDGITENQAKS